MSNIVSWLTVHAAALGLLGQALYLFTVGDVQQGITVVLAALAAFGLGQGTPAAKAVNEKVYALMVHKD